MLIVTILLGLVGLGLVVVLHELGHYAAARAMGVEVEAFSVGWGPRIASFRRGGTEWRFSALPLGGYCKMKGEEAFQKALEQKADSIPREPGTFYGAAAWRRIVIALAGPLVNVLFAIIVFMVVSTISYTTPTFSNRIVLLSEFNVSDRKQASYPADLAGLKSGDRILEANGKKIGDFSDLLQEITLSANKPVAIEIERDGQTMRKTVTPMLDKDTGAGLMGVTYWADPVVGAVAASSAAQIAGLQVGDKIVSLDGAPVRHAVEFLSMLEARKPERATIGVLRSGQSLQVDAVLSWTDQGKSNLGLSFKTETHRVPAASDFPSAVRAGWKETVYTFDATLAGLASLFQGINVFNALSGPARITYMVGQSATEGIQNSSSGGLAIPLNIIAFLSIGLFIMNLLPIPALDGGQIVMFVIEIVRRKMMKPISIYRYQAIGAAFILAIFVIATIGDLIYFTK